MTISYTNNIPAGGNNPSSDRPIMTTNVNATSAFLAIDHDPFLIDGTSSPSVASGYHTVIHQVLQNSDPLTIANVNQVYSKLSKTGFGTDTQLWSKTGQGGVEQLTGNSALQNGWCFCSGLIFQWGTVTTPLTAISTGNVIFPVPFPGNVFNIQMTLFKFTGGVVAANSLWRTTAYSSSLSQFSWQYTVSLASTYDGFSWFAIGN